MTNWIKPEHGLPENDEFVLVQASGKGEGYTAKHAPFIGSYYAGDGWELEATPPLISYTVEAWMPLPEEMPV